MHPDDLRWPAIHFRGRAYFLKRADAISPSYFGGPLRGEILGKVTPSARLHHIATIEGQCFPPLWQRVGGGALYLIYGMAHEGCEIRYRRTSRDVEIIDLDPAKTAANWPYPDYPRYLSYCPLELEREMDCTLAQFLDLSVQPLEASDSEALIIVPPIPTLGMSLWGPDGDSELVQMIFRCNLETEEVVAWNQCG